MGQKIHQGRNIKRFREMMGIKQEALAYQLGDDWNQKRISLLEQKEEIEDSHLSQVAEVLKLPLEAFRNFDEEKALDIIANTFHKGSIICGKEDAQAFHPIEKLVQLHEEKIALYERMLREKDEMMARFERLLQ